MGRYQEITVMKYADVNGKLADYRRFVVSLSERVAGAKADVSDAEQAAIAEITTALGS